MRAKPVIEARILEQEIGGESSHHIERAVGEIDDGQHAKNDGKAQTQQRIEGAIDEADQQQTEYLPHADRAWPNTLAPSGPSFDRRHHTPSASCSLFILPSNSELAKASIIRPCSMTKN